MPGEALQFAASLAAIIVLVAITYGLGFRTGATLSDEAEARELFRLAPGGFEPEDIILDANRTCALARDRESRLALLLPHGSRFVVRPLPAESAVTADGGVLRFAAAPNLVLDAGAQAQDWATRTAADNKASCRSTP